MLSFYLVKPKLPNRYFQPSEKGFTPYILKFAIKDSTLMQTRSKWSHSLTQAVMETSTMQPHNPKSILGLRQSKLNKINDVFGSVQHFWPGFWFYATEVCEVDFSLSLFFPCIKTVMVLHPEAWQLWCTLDSHFILLLGAIRPPKTYFDYQELWGWALWTL